MLTKLIEEYGRTTDPEELDNIKTGYKKVLKEIEKKDREKAEKEALAADVGKYLFMFGMVDGVERCDKLGISFAGVSTFGGYETHAEVLKKRLRDATQDGDLRNLKEVLEAIKTSPHDDEAKKEIFFHEHDRNKLNDKEKAETRADKAILLIQYGAYDGEDYIAKLVKELEKKADKAESPTESTKLIMKARELETTYALFKAADETSLVSAPQNATQPKTIDAGVRKIREAVEGLKDRFSPEGVKDFIETLIKSDKNYSYEQQKAIINAVLDSLPKEEMNNFNTYMADSLIKGAVEKGRAGFLRALRENGADVPDYVGKIEEAPGTTLTADQIKVNEELDIKNDNEELKKVQKSKDSYRSLKEETKDIDWHNPKEVKKLDSRKKDEIRTLLENLRIEELKQNSGLLHLDEDGKPVTIGVLAATVGNEDTFKDLKKKGYNVAEEANPNDLAHLAASHGNIDALRALAGTPGIDFNATDEKGKESVYDKIKKMKNGNDLLTEFGPINAEAIKKAKEGAPISDEEAKKTLENGDDLIQKILEENKKAGQKDNGWLGLNLSKRIPDTIKKVSDNFFDSLTKSEMTMEQFSITLTLSMFALPLDIVGQFIELSYKPDQNTRLDTLNEQMTNLIKMMAAMKKQEKEMKEGKDPLFRSHTPTAKEQAFRGLNQIFVAAASKHPRLYAIMQNDLVQAFSGPDGKPMDPKNSETFEIMQSIYNKPEYRPLLDEVKNQANSDNGLQILSNVLQVLPEGVNQDQFLGTFGVDKDNLPPPTIDKDGHAVTPDGKDSPEPKMTQKDRNDLRDYQAIFDEVKERFPGDTAKQIAVLKQLFPTKSDVGTDHEMALIAIKMMENESQRNILRSIGALNREAYSKMDDTQKSALNITPPEGGDGRRWGSAKLAHSVLSTLEKGTELGETESTFKLAKRTREDDPYIVTEEDKGGKTKETPIILTETAKAMARIRDRNGRK